MLLKLVLFMCAISSVVRADSQELQLKISHNDAQTSNRHEEKVQVCIVLHGNSPLLQPLAECIRGDLEKTDQIQVKIIEGEAPKRTEDIAQQLEKGYPFAWYLSMHDDEAEVHSRLYNTLDVAMVQGKKWKKRDDIPLWAHHMAHAAWKEIMGTESSFLSSIVYVTKDYNRAKKVKSQLVVTAWDGTSPRVMITRPTHVLAPCWLIAEKIDEKAEDAMVIFSEFTPVNVRLMKVKASGHGVAEVVFNQQGTTVGVSPHSSETIVYCRSGVIWRCTYDPESHTSTHTPVIREKEPCACPIALHNGDIIYCSQGKIKRWHGADGTKEVICKDGFCTSPAFHEERNILIFSRRVKGHFQLICKDLNTGLERQITQGTGNKIDPSISPCGFFVAYTLEQGKKSRICILNVLNNVSQEISPASDYCMCPSWSPI